MSCFSKAVQGLDPMNITGKGLGSDQDKAIEDLGKRVATQELVSSNQRRANMNTPLRLDTKASAWGMGGGR